ncbi:MAG: tetratricopeptide repeat protein [Bacteroidia bacterium]|nr:tetratricopeptide repeat protein [Bacteroidia bacterium]
MLFVFACLILGGILGNSTAFAQAGDTLFLTREVTLLQLDSLSRAQSSPHALVYRRACQLRDYPAAIQALHYLLVEDPQNPFYQDSLAALYYRTGNFSACITLGNEIMLERPEDGFIHLILANAKLQSGNSKAALNHYGWLAEGTGQLFFWYQKASLEFHLERLGECRASLGEILASESKTEMIRIENGGEEYLVSMEAAALNMLGNLDLKAGNKDSAAQNFQQALDLYPDFGLARANLDNLKKRKK